MNRKRITQDPFILIGSVILIILFLLPFIQNYLPSPFEQDLKKRLLHPGISGHLLGTDQFGRDLLSRLVFGIRISIYAGIFGSLISIIIGIFIGSVAGFFGKKIDTIMMRLTDMVMGFPSLLLLIALSASLKPSLNTVILAIGLVSWTGMARLIRSLILSLKSKGFIDAAKSMGYSNFQILLNHIFPNCFGPIIISFTLGISAAIMAEASLSFLGLGTQPPMPSWGIMISEGKDFFRSAPYISILPGCAIAFGVMGFNLLSEGLRDYLEND